MHPDHQQQPEQGDTTTRPDPSRLTREAIDRALVTEMRVVDTRLNAIDEATSLLRSNVLTLQERTERERDKAAADIGRQLDSIRDLFTEKLGRTADVAGEQIAALRAMIADRDERVKQAAAESAVGLAAALAAQKEAVAGTNAAVATASNKQEVAFQRSFDQQAATFGAQINELRTSQADLKDRLVRAEQALLTRTEVKTEGRLSLGALVAVGMLLLTLIVAVVGFRTG
jgi:hypothetical protein